MPRFALNLGNTSLTFWIEIGTSLTMQLLRILHFTLHLLHLIPDETRQVQKRLQGPDLHMSKHHMAPGFFYIRVSSEQKSVSSLILT